MSKKICGPMRPPGWVAIIVAILVANIGDADGQERFTVSRSGDPAAQSVILIPGLATSGDVWTQTVGELGASADIHVVSVAGFGRVATVGQGAFIHPVVVELGTYIDAEGLHDVILVGHSLGGQIALQVAAAHPDVVSRVLVVDSAPFYARLFNPAVTAEQAAAYGQSLATQMSAMSREQFLASSRQGLAIQSISEEGQAQVLAYIEASDQQAVARAMGEIAGSDFRPVLDDVTARVTILTAWADPSPVTAERLQAMYVDQYSRLANAQVKVIAGARHFIMLDQPEAFMIELRSVLSDH